MVQSLRPVPSSFKPPILTAADLDNHPLAAEYIAHLTRQHYPMDFQAWIKRREIRAERAATKQRQILQQAIDDPFCRSPLKRRVIR